MKILFLLLASVLAACAQSSEQKARSFLQSIATSGSRVLWSGLR